MSDILIGLTGSMGAGKSEASRAFERLGVSVYDADILGHYALEKIEDLRDKVLELLGADVLVNGQISRAIIAKKVFADPRIMADYEAIIHPVIRRLWRQPLDFLEYQNFLEEKGKYQVGRAERESLNLKFIQDCSQMYPAQSALLFSTIEKIENANVRPRIVEAALLFEKKLETDFDICLDVHCSEGLRYARLEKRGMNLMEISARDAFQFTPEKKASLANVVLFNESDRFFLQVQAALCLSRLI